MNELSQYLEFLCATALDSARIVKNVTRIIGEHKFIVDGVLASLAQCQWANKESRILTNIHRRFKFELVGSEIRVDTLLDTKCGPRTSSFCPSSPHR